MKTTIIFMLLGALCGIAIASWVVPPALSWYTEPGGLPRGAQIQAIVQIPEVIRYATGKLIRWQMISAVLGAIAGLVLGFIVTRRRKARAVIALLVATSLATAYLRAEYVQLEVENVPVARLIANLERMIRDRPNDANLHLNLARTHAMAWAQRTEQVKMTEQVKITKGHEERGPFFGYSPDAVPFRVVDTNDAERLRAAEPHLKAAMQHYEDAIKLAPNNLTALLGRAWFTERTGDRVKAITLYRDVIEKAWAVDSKREAIFADSQTITGEAAGYLMPLLDPRRDAAEIARIRKRLDQLEQKGRMITPIAIPLRNGMSSDDMIAPSARVTFDADGSGLPRQWTWISPDAGWLVYNQRNDPSITSALQLFGNVTFWLFWDNGYEALAALDDNGDGRLEGAELMHLAVWRDINSNGRNEPGEVRSLKDLRIAALSCRYTIVEDGLAEAWSPNGVTFDDGSQRPTWDVLLRSVHGR